MIDYLDVRNSRHSSTKQIIEDEIGIDNILVSAITKIELIAGAVNKSDLRSVNKNIKLFGLLLIKTEISELAISCIETYNLSHGLALPDAFIAATSLYTQIPLFTYNVKDYKFINGLKLYQPTII
ncbi:PIN domain-containing protein [Mucilaginibacter pedocola]|uniref:PIN domain-containing protein n=1 Tax=Mucilaginibacter pedocola TaxID=1792845 RepID=A0A1S9PAR2_9SPHI|nr:PIN domain-containing protein [Mucilaginibacter pedocola]OOQ58052.1 hypothetical protein BC343_10340 [Mucilaginibacter pedocola]